MHKNIAGIILAAGKGERMKSQIPKALHTICGRPMLSYVLDLARGLKIKKTVVVLGHKQESVRKIIPAGIKTVIQKKLIGTADAVRQALSALKGFKETVLVLYGDIPLLKKETLKKLLEQHLKNNADATILTAEVKKPAGYGRVLRDKYSVISGIIEEKDADDFQKEIKEVNTGIICFDKDKLASVLKDIRPDNRKKEYYLTDAIGIFYKKGYLIDSFKACDIQEALGINSRADLVCANALMQKRINKKLMSEGVTIIDPRSAFINYGTKIGQDSVIYPFTVIERNVKIGRRCHIGPFIHLREETVIADETTLGNFIEVTRSKIGAKTIAKHFSYLGDSHIGRSVNIGAGTVTANFDGRQKNLTVIENGAFIGSDTVMVAPVKIGKRATTGAGAVVTKNVASNTTVVGVPAKILKRHR